MVRPLALKIAATTVRDITPGGVAAPDPASLIAPARPSRFPPARPLPAPLPAMDPSSTSSPALSVALAVLAVLLSLTGFGVYQAFGPPSKALSDPFDDHDD